MESVHHDAVKNYFQRASRHCCCFHSALVARESDVHAHKRTAEFPPAQGPAGVSNVLLALLPYSIATGKSVKPVTLGKVIHALGLNFCIFKIKELDLLRSQLLERDNIENIRALKQIKADFIHISATQWLCDPEQINEHPRLSFLICKLEIKPTSLNERA